ncbi:MAG: hypothetical protein JST31_09285 [Actinobacteria bacterium]|nr:hypothetical protein [Actinomycetota bacterium]
MAFHVEIAAGINHARSFNLSEEELRRTVVAPWIDRRPIELGDRKWTPAESELRILEGPELSYPELSFGNGWANAERGGEFVTRRLLDEEVQHRREGSAGPAAIVIETDSAVRTLAGLVSGERSQSVDLDAIRARLDEGDPSVAAVVLVVRRPR